MKRLIALSFVLIASIALISWGVTGHRTVALIAEDHLTPQAKAAVADLLAGQSMAEVSTWADEVRSRPGYKFSGRWHYINLPSGLTDQQFELAVLRDTVPNVYVALLASERTLENTNASKEERSKSLKFIIHLVGDLHQPMHVSRKEDQGGNKVQLQYEGQGTNLHSLWDSKLLNTQGLTEQQLADKLNAKFQDIFFDKSEPITWLWESYQISSKLYTEIEKSNKLNEAYYHDHIGIANNRIYAAGLRLAGVLNDIFKDYKAADALKRIPAVTPNADGSITKVLEGNMTQGVITQVPLKGIASSEGKTVSVTGKVFGSRSMNSFLLVNLGAAYPDQLLTVVLRGEAMKKYNKDEAELDKFDPYSKSSLDKSLTVSGVVTIYKRKPQIEVTDPLMIRLGSIILTNSYDH